MFKLKITPSKHTKLFLLNSEFENPKTFEQQKYLSDCYCKNVTEKIQSVEHIKNHYKNIICFPRKEFNLNLGVYPLSLQAPPITSC